MVKSKKHSRTELADITESFKCIQLGQPKKKNGLGATKKIQKSTRKNEINTFAIFQNLLNEMNEKNCSQNKTPKLRPVKRKSKAVSLAQQLNKLKIKNKSK